MIHQAIHLLYYLLVVLVVGHVLMAYFPDWRYHPLGAMIFRISDPLLAPIRRLIPPIQTGSGARLDISPAVLLTLGWIITEVAIGLVGRR